MRRTQEARPYGTDEPLTSALVICGTCPGSSTRSDRDMMEEMNSQRTLPGWPDFREKTRCASRGSMRDVLKPIDYQILASEAEQVRWQNSAQWARNLMVKEGLLQVDSPVGIWEITEKGRGFLQNQRR